MVASEPPILFITVRLPMIALEQVNSWASKMELEPTEFHTRALVMGARLIASSFAFIPSLPSRLRKRAIQATNDNITPEMIGQVIMGNQARGENKSTSEPETDLTIGVPAEMQVQFDQAIRTSGMMPLKFYSLAFATGAQTIASTLAPESVFSPEVSALIMEKNVTPEKLMKSVRKRKYRDQSNPKRTNRELARTDNGGAARDWTVLSIRPRLSGATALNKKTFEVSRKRLEGLIISFSSRGISLQKIHLHSQRDI